MVLFAKFTKEENDVVSDIIAIDRETGELQNCFLPRFAVRQ